MWPLLNRLTAECGYPVATTDNLDELIAQQEHLVLFFTNDPGRYPESSDVAVILPELQQLYGDRFQVALVARESEEALRQRFPFNQWPALVFLRRGTLLGVISKVRDWAEYRTLIDELLAAGSDTPQRIPNLTLS